MLEWKCMVLIFCREFWCIFKNTFYSRTLYLIKVFWNIERTLKAYQKYLDRRELLWNIISRGEDCEDWLHTEIWNYIYITNSEPLVLSKPTVQIEFQQRGKLDPAKYYWLITVFQIFNFYVYSLRFSVIAFCFHLFLGY